jgi:acyl-coenzyme A synthetase/AMP-(fatty) acid ligase
METYRYRHIHRTSAPAKTFLNSLRRSHQALQNKVALIEEKRQLTFGELWKKVDLYTSFFRKKRVREGEIVVIVCPMNSVEVCCTVLALMQIKAAPLVLNLADKFQKLQPSDVGARGFIIHKDIQKYLQADKQAEYEVEGQLEPEIFWCRQLPGHKPLMTDAALLVTSSGSTNRKKIIKYGFEGIQFNVSQNIEALDIRPSDRTLMVLPLTYSYGLIAQLFSHLSVGATVVFSNKRLMTNAMVELISRHKVTSVFTAPPIFRQLVFMMERFGRVYAEKYSWATLRYITVGGNHIEAGTVRRALGQFGCSIVKTYGLAEAGPRVATRWIRSPHDTIDSNGAPLANVRIHVCDEQGRRLEAGRTGRLIVETPSAALGYLFESDNCLKIEGRMVHTNDYGYLSPEGQLKILGRKGHMLHLKTLEAPVFRNDLSDLLYSAFYIMKLQILQVGEGRIRIDIVAMPGCRPQPEAVIRHLDEHFGASMASCVEVAFPKIGEIKIDK